VMFCGNCVKMGKDSTKTLMTKGMAVASQHWTVSHFLSHKGIFAPHPPYSPDFPHLQMFFSCHFDTSEVIQAQLQAVLNTLLEHDFQNEFKTWQNHWEWCTRMERDYFDGDGGQ
jgi:hypothetical protein